MHIMHWFRRTHFDLPGVSVGEGLKVGDAVSITGEGAIVVVAGCGEGTTEEVDSVTSILVDENSTTLVISGTGENDEDRTTLVVSGTGEDIILVVAAVVGEIFA